MAEPLTSLLIRELTIAAGAAGKLARCLDEMARVLRLHLQPDVESATRAINTGKSGAEESRSSGPAPLLPFPDPLWSTREES